MKLFFKILLIVFVLQSTWVLAAQYCQHEEGSKVEHVGHHSHKHTSQNEKENKLSDQKTGDKSKSDTDCSYCHLGSIKSLITTIPILESAIEPLILVDINYGYPEIIPLKPERPNWNLAV